jgi:cellobiose-specific phosphotransferase system component IIC
MERMEVVLYKGEWDTESYMRDAAADFVYTGKILTKADNRQYYPDRVFIPYRNIFIFTLVLIFAGAILLVIGPGRNTNTDQNKNTGKMEGQNIKKPWKIISVMIGVVLAMTIAYGLVKEIWPQAIWLRILVSMAGFFVLYLLWERRHKHINNARQAKETKPV